MTLRTPTKSKSFESYKNNILNLSLITNTSSELGPRTRFHSCSNIINNESSYFLRLPTPLEMSRFGSKLIRKKSLENRGKKKKKVGDYHYSANEKTSFFAAFQVLRG